MMRSHRFSACGFSRFLPRPRSRRRRRAQTQTPRRPNLRSSSSIRRRCASAPTRATCRSRLKAGEGFENKLAELFARKLGKGLAYEWYPQATGFIRMTLLARRCDVVMGYPLGDDLVQPTNPYYRSAYALVFKPGTGLDGIEDLEDPRLKDKRVGVVAGTPPSNNMAAAGLMAHAKPYPLVIDTRYDSSAQAMIHDLESGEIDVGVLWGPMAGYYAKQAKSPCRSFSSPRRRAGRP